MHVLLNLLFLFIYVFLILQFKILDVLDGRQILHKFIIFISIFIFQFIILVISRILNGCVVNLKDIALNALLVAVAGVVGYSVYNDMIYMGTIKKYNIDKLNNTVLYLNITVIIIMFITFVKIIDLLINSPSKCS